MPTDPQTRLAVISHLYPHKQRENVGIFVYEQMRALAARGDVRSTVIAPVPFAPWPLSSASEKWAAYAAAEPARIDFDDTLVTFPRYLSFPRKRARAVSARTAVSAALMSGRVYEAVRSADALIAHTALLDGEAARTLSERFDIPYIVFVHGEDLYQNIRGPQADRLAPAVYRVLAAASAVIAVSDPLADGLYDAFCDLPRPHVLPNGVDVDMFSPAEEPGAHAPAREPRPLRLLSAGHLATRKAHAYVLHALAALRERGIEVAYTVAGDGPERSNLEALATELRIAGQVRFLGAYRHEGLPALLHEADLFAMPSWDEAFGVVYLESLACGVPAIAANDGGARTIIDDGVDGFLVEPRSAEQVATAIERFVAAGAAGRSAMQSAAREKALRYTWDANAQGLLDIVAGAIR